RVSDFMRRQERRRSRLQLEAGGVEELITRPGDAPPGDKRDGQRDGQREGDASKIHAAAGAPAPAAPPANGQPAAAMPAASGPATGASVSELDRRAKLLGDQMANRFAQLAEKLQSSLRQAADARDLAALKSQVGEMAGRLDALGAQPRSEDNGPELKAQIDDLGRRLAAAESRFAGLDDLDNSIAELTSRLDKAEDDLRQNAAASRADARELDKQFAALFDQLEGSREAMLQAARLAAAEIAESAAAESAREAAEVAVRRAQQAAVAAACEAARQAAREAVEDAAANGASSGAEAEIIAQLRDNLNELRGEIDGSDRSSREAIDAIEDNLRDLVQRLDDVEARATLTATGPAGAHPAVSRDFGAEDPRPGERKGPGPAEAKAMPAPEAAALSSSAAARSELPDDLAELRLPPLTIEDAILPASPLPLAAELAPDDGDLSTLEMEEADDTPAESMHRREPGSGPPQAILDSLGLGKDPKPGQAGAGRGEPAKAANAVSAPPPAKAPEPAASANAPSLGGARTTNELLAAARRAAEAASGQVQNGPEKDRQSLRERLRIPLTRKASGAAPTTAEAKAKVAAKGAAAGAPASAAQAAKAAQAAQAAKTAKTAKAAAAKPGAKSPAVRKPILLAAAAVILIAGSVEIYNMIKDRPAQIIDATPVIGGTSDNAAVAPASPESTISRAAPQTAGNGLDDHLPRRDNPAASEAGGAAPAAVPAPEAKESEGGNDLAPLAQPGRDTTSSLTTDPQSETGPLAQRAAAGAAEQLPALPEDLGPEALRQAAIDGNPIARFEVASRLAEGRGTAPDPASAARWFQLAAASGLAPAQYRLGSLYEKGIGVAKDRAAAAMWYERAAEQGNRKAMHNLAVLNADGIKDQPEFAAAARWFSAAAELGLQLRGRAAMVLV
ncbi:MAG TPA: tetratricopeptide repeat protein, partial [Hyphomicrobiales bacterium]|nr:tetratricopeptide repeat protein [Hyphomicrobiales bacterium]